MRRSTRYWLGQRPTFDLRHRNLSLSCGACSRKRGELLRSASELLSWAKRACSTAAARQLTGSTPKSFNVAIRRFRWKWIGYLSLMARSGLQLESVANETGFGDRERMRRSFVRAFGQTPQAIRNAARPLASF